MMGVVKGLKALAEVPPAKRTAKMNAKIAELVEFLLAHRLYQRSRREGVTANERWVQLGFPRFWWTDVLEMLSVLTKLGFRMNACSPRWIWCAPNRAADGRWLQERDVFQRAHAGAV